MISCRDCWPWTKPGYITMTRRQSNKQWSSSIAANPAQKIPSAKIRWKSSRLDFLGSRRHCPHCYLPKGQTINAEYYSSLLVQLKGILKEKLCGDITKGVLFPTSMPRLTEHLQPRRNWASNVLITHPILRIWPRQTTTCSLDWKTIERSPFFVRRGGHCCRGDLVRRTIFCGGFFFFGLHKLEQRAKKCIELRGEYVE